jgi:transcription elongation GreA/GreB family factor
MKRAILNEVIKIVDAELARLRSASAQSNRGALHSAPRAEKQRDTTGLEAAYLAHGYAQNCNELAWQLEELKRMKVEDFTGQEIDVGAVVEVELDGEADLYMLLNGGGGTEVNVDGQTVTVITPESPIGKSLMGNVEAGSFSFREDMEGIILSVY